MNNNMHYIKFKNTVQYLQTYNTSTGYVLSQLVFQTNKYDKLVQYGKEINRSKLMFKQNIKSLHPAQLKNIHDSIEYVEGSNEFLENKYLTFLDVYNASFNFISSCFKIEKISLEEYVLFDLASKNLHTTNIMADDYIKSFIKAVDDYNFNEYIFFLDELLDNNTIIEKSNIK